MANRRRRRRTRRRRTPGTSKAEDRFYDMLVEKFGLVLRQVGVNGWSIDFYIPQVNTYVQYDGLYWHGLNRPLEEIKGSKRAIDSSIYETYLRDRRQEAWFSGNNHRLVRVIEGHEEQALADI